MRRLLPALIALAMGVPAPAAAAPSSLTDLRRYPLRVHVAQVGAAGLQPDRMTTESTSAISIWDDYVVIEERADAVRIVLDDDNARLLLWIPTADLAWTVARPTRIVGRGAAGVWINPGAPLAITGDGKRVAASYTDGVVTVQGALARTALTHSFRPRRVIDRGTAATAHFAREPEGPPLVTTTGSLGVRVLGRGPGDWRLVEYAGRDLRIVGWARAADVIEGGFGSLHGTGVGSGYAISDTDRVEVPAGACLFDPDGGAVVGVQTATAERYAGDLGGGAWSVTIGNAWGLRQVIARELAGNGGARRWQMCR